MKDIKFLVKIKGVEEECEVTEIDFVQKHLVVKEFPCSYYKFEDIESLSLFHKQVIKFSK